MKRLNQYYQSYCSPEDQDQAEAAFGGALGVVECMWPPRSYSCSFCKREFRSAQALGGHMNVHRRDRALLKQVTFLDQSLPSSPPLDQHHHKSLLKSKVANNPSQLCLPRTIVPNLSASTLSKFFSNTQSLIRPSHNQYGSGIARKVVSTNNKYWKEEISYDEEKRDYLRSKRCKKSDIDDIPSLPFFDVVKNVKGGPDLSVCNSIEELDLELRLGGAP